MLNKTDEIQKLEYVKNVFSKNQPDVYVKVITYKNGVIEQIHINARYDSKTKIIIEKV